MSIPRRLRLAALLALPGAAACGSAGGIRGVVASVMRAPRDHFEGIVQSVDPAAHRIALRSSRGETLALAFDEHTRVVFRNRTYVVTALARGDEVVAHLRAAHDSTFYTDSVHVTIPMPEGADSSSTLAPEPKRP